MLTLLQRWLAFAIHRAEQIGLGAETILFLVFGLPYRLKEFVLIPLVRWCWPRWLTANVITASRGVMGLIVLALICFQRYEGNQLLLAIFSLGIVTDLFDGIVARALEPRRSKESIALGSFLDKLADRLLFIPIGFVEYWHHDIFIIHLTLIVSTVGAMIALSWQFINWIREQTRDVPENFTSKLSFMVFVPSVIIPILWPDQWWLGFHFGLAATVLAIGSLWKGAKDLFNILSE